MLRLTTNQRWIRWVCAGNIQSSMCERGGSSSITAIYIRESKHSLYGGPDGLNVCILYMRSVLTIVLSGK
uniref:Uncharacterized protein n=1 Tax=Physcomitrium patens TaxID=3218 RepID=A0A2K1JH10_PHYPA|nr:hypothetical protein PHYPA_018240 [Physcomitrium patens]